VACANRWNSMNDISLLRRARRAWKRRRQYRPEGWRLESAAEVDVATYFDVHHAQTPAPDLAAAARAVCCLELRA